VLDSQFNDLANLLVIDSTLDGRDKRDIEADGCKAIKSKEFFFKDVGLAANDAVCLAVKPSNWK